MTMQTPERQIAVAELRPGDRIAMKGKPVRVNDVLNPGGSGPITVLLDKAAEAEYDDALTAAQEAQGAAQEAAGRSR